MLSLGSDGMPFCYQTLYLAPEEILILIFVDRTPLLSSALWFYLQRMHC